MVGPQHTQSSHTKLYYSDQIPLVDPDTTDQEFNKYMNRKRKKRLLGQNKNIKEAAASRGGTKRATTTRGGGTSRSSGGEKTSRASSGGRTSGASSGGRGGY